MVMLSLSGQACAQNMEPSQESNTNSATVEALAHEPVRMTLEEIRAKQAKLEAQIAEIRGKVELERADKIALLKLTNILIVLKKSENAYQQKVIQEQKRRLAHEFAKIRKETKN